jgi:hypothetical protein
MLVFGSCLLAVPAFTQEAFRIVLVRQGNSLIDSHLSDVNDRVVAVPAGSQLTVKVVNGEIRELAKRATTWVRVYEAPVASMPDFEFRSSNPYWPDDISLTASLQPPHAAAVKTNSPLVIVVPPKATTAFPLALLGAVLIAGHKVFEKPRTRSSMAAAIGGALAAATIAFFVVDSKTVWQFVGFKDETPLRPQSYFLLGLMISAIGVRPLVNALRGRQSETDATLTAKDVQEQISTLLSSDKLQEPFRNELRAILFDPAYLKNNPEIATRVDVELAAEKAGRALPEGLADHLAPRLHSIYSGSHRRNFQTTINAVFRPADHCIEWAYHIVYEYVRNANDPSTDAEVGFSQKAHIPAYLRNVSQSQLSTFGPIFQSLQMTLTNSATGERAQFEHVSGGVELVCASRSATLPAPVAIPVTFESDEETKQLSAEFAYKLPDALRRHPLTVAIDLRYISEIDDGVSYVRVSRLTQGYRLNVTLPAGVKSEIVEFEWKMRNQDPTTIDLTNGLAILPGWLMPGNGVCVAWRGTKAAADAVNITHGDTKPPGLVRRMLTLLPWNR